MHKTNEHILFQTKHRHERTKSIFDLLFLCFVLILQKKNLGEFTRKKEKYNEEHIIKCNRKKKVKIINRIQCIRLIQNQNTPQKKMKTKLPTYKNKNRLNHSVLAMHSVSEVCNNEALGKKCIEIY